MVRKGTILLRPEPWHRTGLVLAWPAAVQLLTIASIASAMTRVRVASMAKLETAQIETAAAATLPPAPELASAADIAADMENHRRAYRGFLLFLKAAIAVVSVVLLGLFILFS